MWKIWKYTCRGSCLVDMNREGAPLVLLRFIRYDTGMKTIQWDKLWYNFPVLAWSHSWEQAVFSKRSIFWNHYHRSYWYLGSWFKLTVLASFLTHSQALGDFCSQMVKSVSWFFVKLTSDRFTILFSERLIPNYLNMILAEIDCSTVDSIIAPGTDSYSGDNRTVANDSQNGQMKYLHAWLIAL